MPVSFFCRISSSSSGVYCGMLAPYTIGCAEWPQFSVPMRRTRLLFSVSYSATEHHPKSKIVHCFVDDYQFVRYWNAPDKYIPKLSKFAAVCAPDFSMYTDMPLAMQIYNHYRKHWLQNTTM